MNNKYRQGRFTSSQAFRVIGTPAVRKTYIEEKQIEKRMKRCLDTGAYSQAMAWGRYMENRVFRLMGMSYTMVSKKTLLHPINGLFWSGSPDMIVFKGDEAEVVAEVKCYYPLKFAKLTDAMIAFEDTGDLAFLKKVNKGKEYWQVVSNAIICGINIAEIITYMPYESEMAEIKNEVENFDGADQWEFRFIAERGNDVLPVLPNKGYYKNLNVCRFQIPEEDINFLTKAMIDASILL